MGPVQLELNTERFWDGVSIVYSLTPLSVRNLSKTAHLSLGIGSEAERRWAALLARLLPQAYQRLSSMEVPNETQRSIRTLDAD